MSLPLGNRGVNLLQSLPNVFSYLKHKKQYGINGFRIHRNFNSTNLLILCTFHLYNLIIVLLCAVFLYDGSGKKKTRLLVNPKWRTFICLLVH